MNRQRQRVMPPSVRHNSSNESSGTDISTDWVWFPSHYPSSFFIVLFIFHGPRISYRNFRRHTTQQLQQRHRITGTATETAIAAAASHRHKSLEAHHPEKHCSTIIFPLSYHCFSNNKPVMFVTNFVMIVTFLLYKKQFPKAPYHNNHT